MSKTKEEWLLRAAGLRRAALSGRRTDPIVQVMLTIAELIEEQAGETPINYSQVAKRENGWPDAMHLAKPR